MSRLVVGLLIAALLAMVAPSTASAECTAYDRPVDRTLNVGFAFIATVVDASGETDPPHAGSAPFDWHVALRIERVLAGEVPDELVFNGWSVGCHSVRGNRLSTGDRVVIATERFRRGHLPVEPFGGDVVVWRWDGDRWQYARRVVGVEEHPLDQFPLTAIRSARTTADIVAIVRQAMPDTATAPATARVAEDPGPVPWIVLLTAGLLGLVAGARLTARGSSPVPPWR